MNEQKQSLFMTKIPVEIRAMIFRHLIDSRPVHVFKQEIWDEKMSHILCGGKPWREDYHGRGKAPLRRQGCVSRWQTLNEGTGKLHFALLLTCKRFHDETIELFYANRTFIFQPYTRGKDQWVSIKRFAEAVHPDSLALVRHVDLVGFFRPYMAFPLNWTPDCMASLTLFKNLKTLRILVDGTPSRNHTTGLETLTTPQSVLEPIGELLRPEGVAAISAVRDQSGLEITVAAPVRYLRSYRQFLEHGDKPTGEEHARTCRDDDELPQAHSDRELYIYSAPAPRLPNGPISFPVGQHSVHMNHEEGVCKPVPLYQRRI